MPIFNMGMSGKVTVSYKSTSEGLLTFSFVVAAVSHMAGVPRDDGFRDGCDASQDGVALGCWE